MSHRTRQIKVARTCALGVTAGIIAACSSLPPVRLETPKPIKIDVDVKVKIDAIKKEDRVVAGGAVGTTRRSRMEQVQNLKNNRIVGENNKGYLAVREIPPAWKGKEDYINEVVAAENNDRQVLYGEKARVEKKPFEEIEKIHAAEWREQSFKGEWIQTPEGEWKKKE